MDFVKLLIPFILLLSLSNAESKDRKPLKKKEMPSKIKTISKTDAIKSTTEAYKYLNRFGYSECEKQDGISPTNSGRIGCSESMESMLSTFQRRHRLPVTKKLDKATLALMNSPRCGLTDYLASITDKSKLW